MNSKILPQRMRKSCMACGWINVIATAQLFDEPQSLKFPRVDDFDAPEKRENLVR